MILFYKVIPFNGFKEIEIETVIYHESFIRIKVSNMIGNSDFSDEVSLQTNVKTSQNSKFF